MELKGCVAVVTGGVGATPALADHSQSSIFQDDQYLVYDSTATVEQTLETLEQLGVQVIRVNVQWITIAPDPDSTEKLPKQQPTSGGRPEDERRRGGVSAQDLLRREGRL